LLSQGSRWLPAIIHFESEASQTLKKSKLAIPVLVAVGITAFSWNAIAPLVFINSGRSPGDPGWPYTVTLFLGLLLSAIGLAVGIVAPQKSLLSKIMLTISGSISGICGGIYYGEMLAGLQNKKMVIFITVLTVLPIAMSSFWLQKSLTRITLLVMGIVSTYGLAFFCATAAFAFSSTNHWLEGTIWTGFLLAIVALVVFFLSLLVKEFKGYRS
jgi:hypothetical protein